ncbi:hypothetical protein BCON_0194g00030 [Botryotinia convoluta]|uniref:Scytalone dehydratase-like domain-containing protein n=1 Tax=Botryotinia convoluta TaxID=54673 RepID=A0A4Z1HYX8_9HELO|nr:hypothetical protein BCON_0194g00030 [Botryotinia convoluta]
MAQGRISFEDYLDLTALVFDWGDSYDAKVTQPQTSLPPNPPHLLTLPQDWKRLESIIAPELLVDYTTIGKARWEAMPASQFMAMVTDDDFLGDPCVKTQHLLGATRWEKISDDYVIGHHQLRAGHQVYVNADLVEIKLKGHSHATNEHYYKKVDGVWKFAGLKPLVRWNEGDGENDFLRVFKGSYKK